MSRQVGGALSGHGNNANNDDTTFEVLYCRPDAECRGGRTRVRAVSPRSEGPKLPGRHREAMREAYSFRISSNASTLTFIYIVVNSLLADQSSNQRYPARP
jgi:hypothetical protein